MQAKLAAATLRRHPTRTLLAVLGVAVSAAMLLDMVMLASGMRESFRRLLDRNGFDVRVSPKGTVPFDSDASIVRASDVARALRALPDVDEVSPVLGAALHVPIGTHTVSAFGIGMEPSVQGDYELVSGADPRARDALVANDAFLGAVGARIGDTVDVAVGYDPQLRSYTGRRRLLVTGVARFLYIPSEQRAAAIRLATLQEMGGAERADRVSLFMIRARDGADVEKLQHDIDAAIPRVTALSTASAIAEAERRLSYFRQLAFILGAVSLVVGFLLVTTLVTVSVNERVGEIAVMRAIGVARGRVVRQIALEGIGISLSGAVLGLFLGLATARYLNSILSGFPSLPEEIDFFLFQPAVAYKALAMLTASGVAAGVYPAWRAASLPIAATLRREAVG